MVIEFLKNVPVERTMVFEEVYEPELAADAHDKQKILDNGIAIWMIVDNKMAGEIYAIEPMAMIGIEGEEESPPLPEYFKRKDHLYIYSTTILPEFQGKGLGQILRAYFLGYVRNRYNYVIGHATTPSILAIAKKFGAEVINTYPNWYGTKRTAWLYRMYLH